MCRWKTFQVQPYEFVIRKGINQLPVVVSIFANHNCTGMIFHYFNVLNIMWKNTIEQVLLLGRGLKEILSREYPIPKRRRYSYESPELQQEREQILEITGIRF